MKRFSKEIEVPASTTGNKEKVLIELPKDFQEGYTHIYCTSIINSVIGEKNFNVNHVSCKAQCFRRGENIVCEVEGISQLVNLENKIKFTPLGIKLYVLVLKEEEIDPKDTFTKISDLKNI